MDKQYRKTIIAGNWKMNLLASGVKDYADDLLTMIPNSSSWCEAVVCVPFVIIPAALSAFGNSHVSVGAQNMSQHESGAFTGEVSALQLNDLGAKYVILGHSERREVFGETDDIINKKVQTALQQGLSPIVCVGESLLQREIGITDELVSYQVKSALYEIDAKDFEKVTIAYEPIWAIGTGMTATPEDAQKTCAVIRNVVGSLYGADMARATSILYGGSMNDKNANELLAQVDIDGGLIGGASLKADTFAAIIDAAKQ
ncbi:MAG: triose-phosphate isomerase [Oscillospiraceae bacterium]|nr:triose-phosphate isomerase [Oscillospiraceae bacterium]